MERQRILEDVRNRRHEAWKFNRRWSCSAEGLKELLSAGDKNLWLVDLSGARLIWSSLSNAEFSRADLSGARLDYASLCHANLSEANLSEASLADANLAAANLYRANLTGANVANAYLYRAELSNASLIGTILNWSSANLIGEVLAQAAETPEQELVAQLVIGGERFGRCWSAIDTYVSLVKNGEALKRWALNVLADYALDADGKLLPNVPDVVAAVAMKRLNEQKGKA